MTKVEFDKVRPGLCVDESGFPMVKPANDGFFDNRFFIDTNGGNRVEYKDVKTATPVWGSEVMW